MCQSPAMARAINQTRVIGPKKAATLLVPFDCTAKRPMRMSAANGTT